MAVGGAGPPPRESRSPACIGVIGGTRGAPPDALRAAAALGRRIAESRAILVTGGEAIESEASVKATAMCAAAKAATGAHPVGIVGILPSRGDPAIVLDRHPRNPDAHQLRFYTGVSSHERNVLTGSVPDVLIALKGEKGTLSEVGYAVRAGRPVIFFDSREALARAVQAKRDEVRRVFADLGEPGYEPDELTRDLEAFLLDERAPVARRVFQEARVQEAVAAAVDLAAASPSAARCPDLKRSPLGRRTADFANAIRELERRLIY